MKNGTFYKVLLIVFLVAVGVVCVLQITKKQEKHKREPEQSQSISKNTGEQSVKQPVNQTVEQTPETVKYPVDSESEEIRETIIYPDYTNNLREDDINPEIYNPYSSLEIKCYFTNTEDTLDKPGAFPLKAQGRLSEDMQIFLNEQGSVAEELRCVEGSLQDNSFEVQSVETNERIKVIYLSDAEIWKFKIERN